MGVQYSAPKNPDGTYVGESSGKIGFYGTTPVTQAATITNPATTVAVSSSAWGFASSTQANAISAGLDAALTALKNCGLIASS